MKKIFTVIIVLIIISVGFWFTKKNNVSVETTTTTYKNSSLNISFNYPKILTASTTNGVIVIHHDIAYENKGDCDMMGDEKTYPRLTDFKVTIQKIKMGLIPTMKDLSPYIPQENFVNNAVVPSPGFIDIFKVGNLDGFAIYEGAEGCGQTTYYFPIGNNETLVITKASIQILSGVVAKDKMNEVLAVPGVISKEKSEAIFDSILETLKI
jgi:uncharacterized protein YxeA